MANEWRIWPMPRIDDVALTLAAWEAEGWEVVGFPTVGPFPAVALRRPRVETKTGRVRVVMEADLSDLPGFWPDSPTGVTRENVGHLLRSMERHAHRTKVEACLNPATDPAVSAALLRSIDDDIELVHRLLTQAEVTIR